MAIGSRKEDKEEVAVEGLTPAETRAQKEMYSPWTGKTRQTKRKTPLNLGIDFAKRRFEIENGRPPRGKEIVNLMKSAWQKTEKDMMSDDEWKRAQKNRALRKSNKEEWDKQDRWAEKASGYEAMSEAGEKRAEAERIRYNKMVDPDWKPSDDTWTGRQAILNNMRKRDEALNPDNDPEMMSALRNKLDVLPTKAEVERRLMARRNAKLEREGLSAGEAEGAIVAEKAEALKRLRAKELASSRSPQEYDDHRIKTLSDKETRQFKDYKREDGGEVEGPGFLDKLKAYANEKFPTLRSQEEVERRLLEKQKREGAGLSDGWMDDPNIKDEIKEREADLVNRETTLDSTEMDSEALDDWQQDKASDVTENLDAMEALGPDKIEQEGAIDQAEPPTTQEEAQQAIYDVSDEEQKEISRLVAEQKGMGSDEWVETKEATGKYVRYEGSGLVINMEMLQKDIDRNRNMEMLKHIPAANRPAMMVEWGYIDPEDLSVAQKKSAKELKDLELVNLKIAETKLKMANIKGSVPKKDEARYNAALKGFNQALKDKDYGLAEVHRNELNSIMPTGDDTNYTKLIHDGIKKAKIITPAKVFTAAGVKGSDYFKSKQSIVEKVNFLKESKGSTAKDFDLWGQTTIDQGANKGTTYERFFQTQGIFSWDKVDPSKNEKLPKGAKVPDWALASEEAYFGWALPEIEDKLMVGIWGNLHNQVSAINNRAYEEVKKEKADDIIRMPNPWELKAEADKKKAEKKPSEGLMNTEKTEDGGGKTSVEKIHAGSKSRKMYQYDNFTRRANDAEEYLNENIDALTEKEIDKLETQIANYKKRAQEFKTAGEEADKKMTEEQERDKLHKELKAYNKKRKKANLGYIRMDEYKRLKKEGKIK